MKYKTKTLRLKENFILSLLDDRINSLTRVKNECLKNNFLIDLMYDLMEDNQKSLKYLLSKSWVTGIHKKVYLNRIESLKEKENV